MELTINVDASGDYSEEDLKQYLLFCMGFGSCPDSNPFLDEDSDAEIDDIEFI